MCFAYLLEDGKESQLNCKTKLNWQQQFGNEPATKANFNGAKGFYNWPGKSKTSPPSQHYQRSKESYLKTNVTKAINIFS